MQMEKCTLWAADISMQLGTERRPMFIRPQKYLLWLATMFLILPVVKCMLYAVPRKDYVLLGARTQKVSHIQFFNEERRHATVMSNHFETNSFVQASVGKVNIYKPHGLLPTEYITNMLF